MRERTSIETQRNLNYSNNRVKKTARSTCHSTVETESGFSPPATMVPTHLQVCSEAPCILFFVFTCWVDPDEAVVTQNHRGTAWQVMEVSLLPFHQGGGNPDQNTLT